MADEMKWTAQSQEFKKHVNSKIPFFVRGFVDKVITKVAEEIAAGRQAVEVEIPDVAKAYIANTPKPMYGLMIKAMKEKEIDPDSYGFSGKVEERKFPIGEPMTVEEVEDFLNHAVTGRLGTCAAGKPYVVPLSFVYLNGKIYYHWFSYSGRKIQNIKKNRNVCFEADESTHDHLSYKSVIADGKISRVTDKSEKFEVMHALAKKFPDYAIGESHNPEINEIVKKGFEAIAEAAEVYRIDIEHISGKKKGDWGE